MKRHSMQQIIKGEKKKEEKRGKWRKGNVEGGKWKGKERKVSVICWFSVHEKVESIILVWQGLCCVSLGFRLLGSVILSMRQIPSADVKALLWVRDLGWWVRAFLQHIRHNICLKKAQISKLNVWGLTGPCMDSHNPPLFNFLPELCPVAVLVPLVCFKSFCLCFYLHHLFLWPTLISGFCHEVKVKVCGVGGWQWDREAGWTRLTLQRKWRI